MWPTEPKGRTDARCTGTCGIENRLLATVQLVQDTVGTPEHQAGVIVCMVTKRMFGGVNLSRETRMFPYILAEKKERCRNLMFFQN